MLNNAGHAIAEKESSRLPAWFKQRLPDAQKLSVMRILLHDRGLHTVCESARCPNMGECWGQGVATLMILGNLCTRHCRFCAVATGHPQGHVDEAEPERVAQAVEELRLRYVVITSVTRDDLPEEGAIQFEQTLRALRKRMSQLKIELLVPDFSARKDCLKRVMDAGPDVFGHNIEMARSLYERIRPQADYRRSLEVLRLAKEIRPEGLTKSGFMVGLGETGDEVFELMKDLREAGCDLLTIGQYLAPSKDERHIPVQRFVPLAEFEEYRQQALTLGFQHVFSAPLVRSSFIAEQAYQTVMDNRLNNR